MLLCLICGEVFEPKPDEADFLEELFGLPRSGVSQMRLVSAVP